MASDPETPTPEPTDPAPTEFRYVPAERSDLAAAFGPAISYIAAPFIVGLTAWLILGLAWAVVVVTIVVVLVIWWREGIIPDGSTIRVSGGDFTVEAMGGAAQPVRVAMGDLDDIAMETKGTGGAKAGPGKRVVLVRRGGEPIPLTAGFQGQTDTLEWFAKLRVFFRKNGWIPAKER